MEIVQEKTNRFTPINGALRGCCKYGVNRGEYYWFINQTDSNGEPVLDEKGNHKLIYFEWESDIMREKAKQKLIEAGARTVTREEGNLKRKTLTERVNDLEKEIEKLKKRKFSDISIDSEDEEGENVEKLNKKPKFDY